jgi:putative phosphoribosyl transferase
MLFRDRADAGRYLAVQLKKYVKDAHVLVLALPRGGVPVAFEVARKLHAPLDIFLVRKLGVPGQEELAMGAIATGGVLAPNDDVIRALEISDETIASVAARERQELLRRERQYRGDRPAPKLAGRTIILVDDGLATGSSMRAAVAAVRKQNPARIIIAVPVAAASTCAELAQEVDEVICAITPEPFQAVGIWYADFSQTTDEEVRTLLEQAAETRMAGTPAVGR